MALNRLMHPRNPYKERKPNFNDLADKYDTFREAAIVDIRGCYHIDFKKPECLRALTWALLKEDFSLDVMMPLDRLIPTVPLRINYILWLEDILHNKTEKVKGIDIGCGASCVYGLLGARKNEWEFLATETDATNFQYAKKNVSSNGLENLITVQKVEGSTILYDLLCHSESNYDFCMCNPPFFGSNFEAWGMLTSRDDRPEPSSVSTASPAESIVPGGEVDFVKRMIQDSLLLKNRIRIYTSMLGKKSSILVLKEELKTSGVTNVGLTEFCQGKTMRWSLGWSFDDTVQFPKPPSKAAKTEKCKPLVYKIPTEGAQIKEIEYSLTGITGLIEKLFGALEIMYGTTKQTKKEHKFDILATHNTWSNQRRKRRQQMRSLSESKTEKDFDNISKKTSSDQQQHAEASGSLSSVKNGSSVLRSNTSVEPRQEDASPEGRIPIEDQEKSSEDLDQEINEESSPPKKLKTTEGVNDGCEINSEISTGSTVANDSQTETMASHIDSKSNKSVRFVDVEKYLFKASVCLRVQNDKSIEMEMVWTEGQNKEQLHQVMQFFKNRLC